MPRPDQHLALLVRRNGDVALLGRADHRLGQRMAVVDLRAGRIRQTCSGSQPLQGNDMGDDRAADGQCPGLVEHDPSTRPAWSRWDPPLIKMPWRAPLPIVALIAVGVDRPTAQGHAINSMVIAR